MKEMKMYVAKRGSSRLLPPSGKPENSIKRGDRLAADTFCTISPFRALPWGGYKGNITLADISDEFLSVLANFLRFEGGRCGLVLFIYPILREFLRKVYGVWV